MVKFMKKILSIIITFSLLATVMPINAENSDEELIHDKSENVEVLIDSHISYSMEEDGTIHEYFSVCFDSEELFESFRTIDISGNVYTTIYKDNVLDLSVNGQGDYYLFFREFLRYSSPQLTCDSSDPNYSNYSHFFLRSESSLINSSQISTIKNAGLGWVIWYITANFSFPAAFVTGVATSIYNGVMGLGGIQYYKVTVNYYDVYLKSDGTYKGVCCYVRMYECDQYGQPVPNSQSTVNYLHTW